MKIYTIVATVLASLLCACSAPDSRPTAEMFVSAVASKNESRIIELVDTDAFVDSFIVAAQDENTALGVPDLTDEDIVKFKKDFRAHPFEYIDAVLDAGLFSQPKLGGLIEASSTRAVYGYNKSVNIVLTRSRFGDWKVTGIQSNVKRDDSGQVSGPDKEIERNLNMLTQAAYMYFIENPSATTVNSSKLFGPTSYLLPFKSVAGEDYMNITIVKGESIKVKTIRGKVFTGPEL